MLGFQKAGSIVFDYGNNIRGQAKEGGLEKLKWEREEGKQEWKEGKQEGEREEI